MKTEAPVIKLKYGEGMLVREFYVDGMPALRLIDPTNHEPVARLTVRIPGDNKHLDKRHVFIKDWSENEGALEALVAAGVVRFTGTRVPTGGYTTAALCELL